MAVMGVAKGGEPTTAPSELPTTLPLQQDPTVEGKLQQAETALKDGRYDEAVAVAMAALRQAAQEAQNREPRTRTLLDNTVQFVLRLAERAKENDRLDAAYVCYSQLRTMYAPTIRSEPLLGMADVARLSRRSWEAYELYRDYIKLPNRPRDHRGELGMGLTCLALGQFSSAVHYLRAAVRVAPNNSEARMGLARALHGKHENREAVEEARRAVQLNDAEPPEKRRREYRYWLSVILKDAGQFEEAVATVRQLTDSIRAAIKADPAKLDLIDDLDRALTLRHQLLETQSKSEPGSRDPRVFMELAQVVEEQGALMQIRAYYRSLEHMRVAQKLQPDNVGILFEIGKLYRMVGNTGEAIAAYQEILRLAPGNSEAKEVLRAMGAPLTPTEPTTRTTTAISQTGS